MKKIFANYTQDSRTSVGLLIMRLVFGAAMAMHGWPKIQNPTAWAGEGFPAFLQVLAAVSEFGGGIAWVLGAVTVLGSFGIFCTMAMAVYTHAIVKGDPFVGHNGSYELALMYFVFAILMMIAGPGKYSVDHMFCSKCKK